MTKLIYKFILFCWSIKITRPLVKLTVEKSIYLKNKLYKDLKSDGVLELDLDNIKFKLFNPGYTTLENEIYWNGLFGWEKNTLKTWLFYCRKSKYIVDIGANTGLFAISAAVANSNSRVIAYEPVSRTFNLLKKNQNLNPDLNIQIEELALSNKKGNNTLYDVENIHQYSASLSREMYSEIDDYIEYSVNVSTLDEELFDKVGKVDLIKIDVEMHEPEVIQGMLKIIHRDQPTIIIEILTDEIGNRIQELLIGQPYKFFAIDETKGLIPSKNLQKSPSFNFLITSQKPPSIKN